MVTFGPIGRPRFHELLSSAFLPPIWPDLAVWPRTALAASAPPPTADADGRGEPVLLIPGFMAGDASLLQLHLFLRAAGHVPHPSGMSWNVACSDFAVRRLTARAEALAERWERPIALVGHSRGGLLARVVACRRPDLVSSVITLASPFGDQVAVHPLLWLSAATLATLGTLGVPGVLRWSCNRSRCCTAFRADLTAPLPPAVRTLSVYSRADGVVDWRACIDPAGRRLEVTAAHCAMVAHPAVLWGVAAALADFARADDA